MRTPPGRPGFGMVREVDESSVTGGGCWWVGDPEERNLLRGPLALMECIADTRASE